MNKKEVLSFNVGPIYLDFLQSFKTAVINATTKHGTKILLSKIVTREDFDSIDTASGNLKVTSNLYDDFHISLHNHASEVEISIENMNVEEIFVTFKDLLDTSIEFSFWSTRSAILNDKNISKAMRAWLRYKKLTAWASDNVIKKNGN